MLEAVREVCRTGDTASKLADSFGWRKLSSAEVQMQRVLLKVEAVGFTARDVLDMMEENDG